MAITNNIHVPTPILGNNNTNTPAPPPPRSAPKAAMQASNSAEEKAIAVSTTLSKEISKGEKKDSAEEASAEKRKKLIEKISGFNKLNLGESHVDAKAAEIKGQIKSGQNLIKNLLDSQGGDSMLQYAALKKLESSEDPDSKIGIAVAKYIQVLELHKNKTIVSWINTSASIANSTPDKDMAFQIQSMLSNASQNSIPVRDLLSSIIRIGGEERCDEVQENSIKALAADIKSGVASTDLRTLTKTLGTLSNMESVSTMFKIADEQLSKLFNNESVPTVTNTDFLEMSLDISLDSDPKAVTSYSIAVLDVSPDSEYRFCESIAQTFADYPINVWKDSDERTTAIKNVTDVMHRLSDPTKHEESKIRDKLFQ